MFRRNCKNKRLIAGICIGSGIAIILLLYLPVIVWLYIMAVILVIAGIKILFEK